MELYSGSLKGSDQLGGNNRRRSEDKIETSLVTGSYINSFAFILYVFLHSSTAHFTPIHQFFLKVGNNCWQQIFELMFRSVVIELYTYSYCLQLFHEL
jgi:hypothetical protein